MRSQSRRGFLSFEMVVSATLLTVLILVSIQILASLRQQERSSSDRMRALLAVNNVMDEVTSRDWDRLTTEQLEDLAVPKEVADLPGVRLRPVVTEEDSLKRIEIELLWSAGAGGQGDRMVRLCSWVAKRGPRR